MGEAGLKCGGIRICGSKECLAQRSHAISAGILTRYGVIIHCRIDEECLLCLFMS
jgi:hypothetical protein